LTLKAVICDTSAIPLQPPLRGAGDLIDALRIDDCRWRPHGTNVGRLKSNSCAHTVLGAFKGLILGRQETGGFQLLNTGTSPSGGRRTCRSCVRNLRLTPFRCHPHLLAVIHDTAQSGGAQRDATNHDRRCATILLRRQGLVENGATRLHDVRRRWFRRSGNGARLGE